MIHPSEPKHPKRNFLIAAAVYGGVLLALCFLIHLEQLHKVFDGINALLRPVVRAVRNTTLAHFPSPSARSAG